MLWSSSVVFMVCSSSDLPNFFASTKFFACLDLLESQELFEATQMVSTRPYACLHELQAPA